MMIKIALLSRVFVIRHGIPFILGIFTAHSLRSFEAQSSQRIIYQFLFAERVKRNKVKPLRAEKANILCRRLAGFHLPALASRPGGVSQRQMTNETSLCAPVTLR
jgi:hypothetical protein